MIDTHAHIYLPEFDEDRKDVIKRAVDAGVNAIFMPAIDFESLKQMDALNHPDMQFYKMAGIHPCDVQAWDDHLEQKLYMICRENNIYGVGETGLDYYWSKEHVEVQKSSFRAHCRIAKQVKKPVIIHNRESTSDVLQIVEEEQDGGLTGIWHCFNGTVEEGKRAIGMGLLLGIGGVITFKNAGVDKTLAELPLGKMVLETDAPYLSPAPNRGKRNEPAFMKYTAEKLADIFEISPEEVDRVTTKTAERLFGVN